MAADVGFVAQCILPSESIPDHSLRQNVLSTLKSSGYAQLRSLECDVEDGVVELSGCVPSFYLKQMAQVVVMRLSTVKEVRNQVLVP
jgi:osmotically-inducible protein OsmY